MPFPARFAGTCDKCQKAITKGQQITWSRRERGKAYHFDCENPSITEEEVKAREGTHSQGDAQTQTQTQTQPESVQAALAALAQALQPTQAHGVDEDKVREIVLDTVAELESELIKKIQVDVRQIDLPDVKVENVHEKFAELITYIGMGDHVYLYGPPGSGKSTAAKMASEALSREYGYISLNPQTPDSRLMGFIDANGNYRETVFYKLYRDGGVFCIDECDNASPSLLTTLNSCLENGHASFPCGMVPRHPNFVLVATGNTCGKGANPMFPDRRPFDAAFAERFTFILWEYDTQLERTITLAINSDNEAKNWLKWIVKVRGLCASKYPKVQVTPRASFKGAKYLKHTKLGVGEIAESVLFKGLDAPTRSAILTAHPLPEREGK